MGSRRSHIKCIVAALVATGGFSIPLAADEAKMADLFTQLAEAETEDAGHRIEQVIITEWSKSGSAAIDLLLSRGQEALNAGEAVLAAEHFTAAIDHDPTFAEAWHGRATAYYLSGQIGPALDDLRQTLILNPQHFGAMEGFAIMLEEMERPEDALDVWRQIHAIHPTHAGANEAIARLELALGGRTL